MLAVEVLCSWRVSTWQKLFGNVLQRAFPDPPNSLIISVFIATNDYFKKDKHQPIVYLMKCSQTDDVVFLWRLCGKPASCSSWAPTGPWLGIWGVLWCVIHRCNWVQRLKIQTKSWISKCEYTGCDRNNLVRKLSLLTEAPKPTGKSKRSEDAPFDLLLGDFL